MLKKAAISQVEILSDEWHSSRLAKFTSSDAHYLMQKDNGLNYIYDKVGEELSGESARENVDTEATRHGAFFEYQGTQAFGREMGLQFLVTQKLIHLPGSRFASTPDGLIVKRESADELEYEVETVEGKCPLTYHNYIELTKCRTPFDLKRVEKKYYWQVIDQMDNCDSKIGWFFAYHPKFRFGNLHILKFDRNFKEGTKFPLYDDLLALKKAKSNGVEIFETERDILMNKKRV